MLSWENLEKGIKADIARYNRYNRYKNLNSKKPFKDLSNLALYIFKKPKTSLNGADFHFVGSISYKEKNCVYLKDVSLKEFLNKLWNIRKKEYLRKKKYPRKKKQRLLSKNRIDLADENKKLKEKFYRVNAGLKDENISLENKVKILKDKLKKEQMLNKEINEIKKDKENAEKELKAKNEEVARLYKVQFEAEQKIEKIKKSKPQSNSSLIEEVRMANKIRKKREDDLNDIMRFLKKKNLASVYLNQRKEKGKERDVNDIKYAASNKTPLFDSVKEKDN